MTALGAAGFHSQFGSISSACPKQTIIIITKFPIKIQSAWRKFSITKLLVCFKIYFYVVIISSFKVQMGGVSNHYPGMITTHWNENNTLKCNWRSQLKKSSVHFCFYLSFFFVQEKNAGFFRFSPWWATGDNGLFAEDIEFLETKRKTKLLLKKT